MKENTRLAFLAEAKDQFANPSTLTERYTEVHQLSFQAS